MNYGYNDLIDLNAELVSMDNNISIVTSSTDLGDITSGNQVVNSDLAIYIDPATPGGTRSQLNLILTSNDQTWELPVFMDISGALLNIDSYVAQDANGILDPGESADIYFVVENLGQISAISIYGELECLNNSVSIQDSIGFFGNIAPDDTVYNFSNTFEITASSSIIPGTQIPITINFTNESGFNATCSYLIEIGTVTEEDPLGHDEYGYYCYDDDDTAYENCPTYNWVEINNIGDNLNIYTVGDSADIADVILPADFSLVFYGEEYDLITVATAGWISPGGSTAAAFMNWSIPGPGGPSPMIAAFWDDINNGYQGDVFSYYDNTQHYFIVEWDRMRNEHNNEIETFQIILYDPNFYPTTTGDSKIKIQYKDVANTNIGEYPYHGANHGQYCTVGLEDESATIGLQYTYNNSYSIAAKPLQDQMALLFTTPSIPPDGPFLTIMDYSAFAGDDQYIEAGEDAVISITLENIGADDANNIQLTISEDDEYIDILDGNDSCSIVAANDMVTIPDAFTINVSDNVPDYYTFTLNVNITSDEDSWNQSIALTAYQANTFAVFPESIEHELQWGNSDSTLFVLTNIGDAPVNFYIRTDETSAVRDVNGSFLECDATGFTPGETTYWTFTVYNNAIDNEWISDIWIDFPLGVTVNQAGDFVGGSGGNMIWDGNTGQGAYVNWHGMTVNDWGVLHYGETASATLDVTLSTEFAGDLTIDYTIGGDGYGDEPHTIDGEIVLEYPLRWINLSTSSGTLLPDENLDIIINFDTSDIEEIAHTCNIVISSDSWDGKIIPVTLTPIINDNDPQQLPASDLLSQNYPNPFNPSTTIQFDLGDYAGEAIMEIYNIKGQRVRSFKIQNSKLKINSVVWDGKNDNGEEVASGIYFSNLSIDGKKQTRKMIMIK